MRTTADSGKSHYDNEGCRDFLGSLFAREARVLLQRCPHNAIQVARLGEARLFWASDMFWWNSFVNQSRISVWKFLWLCTLAPDKWSTFPDIQPWNKSTFPSFSQVSSPHECPRHRFSSTENKIYCISCSLESMQQRRWAQSLMYLKNKTVARAVHKVLVLKVLVLLGLERRDGRKPALCGEWVHGPQAGNVSTSSGFRRFWGRGREECWWKGSAPFFFSEGRTGRVEILYTLRKEEHRPPLSSGGECPSQETHKRIISSTTRFKKRP